MEIKSVSVKQSHRIAMWRASAGAGADLLNPLADCGSSTEDVQKYSCIDPGAFLTEHSGAPYDELYMLGGLDMRKCEYKVCRLLCATPSIAISAGGDLFHLGDCDVVDGIRPENCYKLKRKLHVGEELTFELRGESSLSEDRVDVQGAVDPGIPIGMDFDDPGSAPGTVLLLATLGSGHVIKRILCLQWSMRR